MRAKLIFSALTLSFLAGACSSGGDGQTTSERLIEICEESRACSLELCSDELAELRAVVEAKPEWELNCTEQCQADGCEDPDCSPCAVDCEAAREAEMSAWMADSQTTGIAYRECEGACRLADDPAGDPDCDTGKWTGDPEWCAAVAGADIVALPDCAEAVESAEY